MAYTELNIAQRNGADTQAHDAVSRGILRVLIYYDLFSFPLTPSEIRSFLPIRLDSLDRVETGLRKLRALGLIHSSEGYWYLADRSGSLVQRRMAMEAHGAKMWTIARVVASFMKRVPFVRGVFISGELCRYVSTASSDIDYFIVTEPNRLWIVRTLLVFARRTLLLNRRKYFCINYFVTTDNLVIRERNHYAACETASLKPIWNETLFRRFVQANSWVEGHFPNLDTPSLLKMRTVRSRRSILQRIFERLIPSSLADSLDRRLMGVTRRYWHRKFPDLPEEAHAVSLRTTEDESRAHPEDPSEFILLNYNRALMRYGLDTV